jgi:hypothetical protein
MSQPSIRGTTPGPVTGVGAATIAISSRAVDAEAAPEGQPKPRGNVFPPGVPDGLVHQPSAAAHTTCSCRLHASQRRASTRPPAGRREAGSGRCRRRSYPAQRCKPAERNGVPLPCNRTVTQEAPRRPTGSLVRSSRRWECQFRPDGLPGLCVARSPSVNELRDDEQSAPAFVVVRTMAEVR